MIEMVFAGILAGFISGLIPGLHVNLLSLFVFLFPKEFSLFLLSMAITHTFVDFIPALNQGAPAQSKRDLPIFSFYRKGKTRIAFLLSVCGGFFSVLFLCLFIFPLVFFLPLLKPFLKILTIFILLFFSLVLFRGKNKIPFFLSALLGFWTFSLNNSLFIFCMISGFFGAGTNLFLLWTKREKIKQKNEKLDISLNPNFFPIFFSSLLVSVFPGIGAANSYYLSSKFKKYSDYEKIFVAGGTNTSASIFSVLVLFILGKGRTGLALMLKQLSTLNPETFFLYFSVILFVSSFVSFLLFFFPMPVFSSKKINAFIVLFLTYLSFAFLGFLGLLVFILAGLIGFLTNFMGAQRSVNMASLFVPVLFYLISQFFL